MVRHVQVEDPRSTRYNFVGHADMAGHNAARMTFGKEPLVLPGSLALADFWAWTAEKRKTVEGRNKSYLVVRGECWERMQVRGLCTEVVGKIKRLVEEAGLSGILAREIP